MGSVDIYDQAFFMPIILSLFSRLDYSELRMIDLIMVRLQIFQKVKKVFKDFRASL